MTGLEGLARAYPFCPRCRAAMSFRFEGGRTRPVCAACGFVQYLNPAPGAGVIVWRDGRVCLVERKFPPKQGQWTLPTGFMEWEEGVEKTAVREVSEETGGEDRLTSLLGVDNVVLPCRFSRI